MSPDMYDALGLVRTQELLAADRYYGVDQYWTRAIDYGFSKTREEALEKWDHDRVLADVVRVIRMTRPLVITSVFVGAPTDGHGNHQVAGQMAQEAFLAAGDPTKFPEQIREGLRPWSPLKVYARVPFFDVTPKGMYDYAIDKYVPVRFFDYVQQKWSSEKPSTTLEIQEGDYAPAAGLTYLQIGREGLGYQKSQNDGVAMPPPAPLASGYHRYGSRVPAAEHEESFFDGIDVSRERHRVRWSGEQPDYLKKGLAEMARLADSGHRAISARPPASHRAAAGRRLARHARADRSRCGRAACRSPARRTCCSNWASKRISSSTRSRLRWGLSIHAAVVPDREPQRAESVCAGRALRSPSRFPASRSACSVDLLEPEPRTVKVEASRWPRRTAKPGRFVSQGAAAKSAGRTRARTAFASRVTAPADAALTRPYFTRPERRAGLLRPHRSALSQSSLAPYPLSASLRRVTYRGVPCDISRSGADHDARESRIGMMPKPLIVGPAISVSRVAGGGRGAAGREVVRVLLHGAQQRQRTGEGHAAPETAGGMALVARVGRILHDARRRRSHHHVLGAPERGRSRRASHHRGGGISRQDYKEGYRLVGYPGSAAVSVLTGRPCIARWAWT